MATKLTIGMLKAYNLPDDTEILVSQDACAADNGSHSNADADQVVWIPSEKTVTLCSMEGE